MPRLGLKWVTKCCLFIVTFGHAYPLPCLSVHHLKRNSFLQNKYWKSEQHFCNEDKNKQVRSQIKIHLKNITKLKNTKNWSTKHQRINTQPIKTKTIKYTHRLRYITSTWITLLKLANTKTIQKLNMKEHKTDMNIIRIDKYKKTEQQFYDGAPNTWTLLNTKN